LLTSQSSRDKETNNLRLAAARECKMPVFLEKLWTDKRKSPLIAHAFPFDSKAVE